MITSESYQSYCPTDWVTKTGVGVVATLSTSAELIASGAVTRVHEQYHDTVELANLHAAVSHNSSLVPGEAAVHNNQAVMQLQQLISREMAQITIVQQYEPHVSHPLDVSEAFGSALLGAVLFFAVNKRLQYICKQLARPRKQCIEVPTRIKPAP